MAKPSLIVELAGLQLFTDVSAGAFADIKPEMVTTLMDGDALVRQGSGPTFLYVLLDGRADIMAGPRPEGRVFIGSRERGDVIGEQAFIESKKHSADVFARGQVRALKLPATIVNSLLLDPTFSRNLLTIVSGKLREATNQRYRSIATNQLLFSHFRSHVDPHVVDALLEMGEDYGRPQFVDPGYVMFCDLRDFTRRSHSMNEFDIAKQLDPYFAVIVSAVHRSSGIVDKYIGDAVMAVWGHPALGLINPNSVLQECLAMIGEVASLDYGGEPIRLGIGLNAGRLFMGNIGNEEKRAFTVLGTTVNMAARYEAANKAADERIYSITVGQSMYNRLDSEHRGLLVARPHTPIRGAPNDEETVYSALL